MTTNTEGVSQSKNFRAPLLIAVWIGMVAGILEAAVLWGLEFKQPQWQILIRRLVVVDANIFWASPLVDVLFFSALGGLLALAALVLPRLRWPALATGFFVALGSYFSMTATGYFRERGAVSLAVGLGFVFARWMNRDAQRGMSFLRRTLKPLAAITLAVVLAGWYGYGVREWAWVRMSPEPPAGAPNVLFIVMDTARADRMGLYGYSRGTTPFLDSLAQQSVVFDHAFASSSWTLPSHVTFFTGRQPHEHHAVDSLTVYDGKFPTLAQFFASRGYRTGGFVANWLYATASHGMNYGFQHYDNLFRRPLGSFRRTMLGRKLEQHGGHRFAFGAWVDHLDAPDINRPFLRWVDTLSGRPFFAFLNFMDLHGPLNPPAGLLEKFNAQPESNGPQLEGSKLSPRMIKRAQFLSGAYDAEFAFLDQQLRALFDELRQRGLDRNLLVVITSDHGESFGEHNILEHRNSLYIEQVRVPLILHFPEKLPRGARVQGAVGLAGLPATIAQLLDAPDHPFPGAPLTECLDGSCADHWVISDLTAADAPVISPFEPIGKGWVRSIATSRWHFLLQEDGTQELYEWAVDPEERNNLVNDPARQDLVKEFRARLDALPPPDLNATNQ